MVRKGSTIRDRVGEAYGNTFGRNQDSYMNRSNNKGPQVSAKVLQSSQDKIIGHLKDAGVKAAAPLAQKIMQNVPLASKVGTMYNLLSPEQKSAITTVAMKAFKGQPLPTTKSSGDSVMNASYGLSKAPNPKPVALNSGILPNCYANDYMAPMLNACSPMHISMGKLAMPTTPGHPMYDYFIDTIAFDIQTRAQSNVGFNLDVSTRLTPLQLLTAFNAAIKGLQLYFHYTSIMAYESDSRNKNAAMIHLRSLITAQTISELTQLGKRLEDTPVPPRIVEWVRYMSMNYLSGNSQGSPLLKIVPNAQDLDTTTTGLTTALADLNSVANSEVFTLIRRSIPSWRIGKLYDVPVVPVYDKNFLTIFANLPFNQYTGTAYIHFPNFANTDNIPYNSYENKLDGAAYAMSGTRVSNLGEWFPGLVSPGSSTTKDSRRSYYTNGTTSSWMNSVSSPFLLAARQETFYVSTVAGPTGESGHLFGTERVLGVTGLSMMQTARNFMDFLYNINAIPTNGKLSHFNRSAENNIVRYR